MKENFDIDFVKFLDVARTARREQAFFERLTVYRPFSGGNTYTYPCEDGAGGYSKPDKVTDETAEAKEIYVDTLVNDQILADTNAAREYIVNRQYERILGLIDNQVLCGDNSGKNWNGILNIPGIQTIKQTQVAHPSTSKHEQYFDVFLQARDKLVGLKVSFVAMNSRTILNLAKIKDADSYDHLSIVKEEMRRYDFDVVTSENIPDNEALIIYPPDFGLLLKESVEIIWGYTGSDSISGAKTVRTLFRGNVMPFRPSSAVKITGLYLGHPPHVRERREKEYVELMRRPS